jgi:hypothetical protein
MDPAVKAYFAKISKMGGKARAAKMTPAQRKNSAKVAAAARWSKQKKEKSA